MQITTTQKTLFEAIVSNLKPFAYNVDGNPTVCSGFIPLELCFIDTRYQGLRKHEHIKRLERNWDVRKLAPITLVPHYDECRFAVVDGQGRCTVAPRKGYTGLQAVVLMNAPQDPEERLKFEAECFIGQDAEVERVKPIEKHTSRVILEDKAAIVVDNAMRKYGVKITAHKGQRSVKILGSYTETYQIAKQIGEDGIDFIFDTIQQCGWSTEANGYGRDLFRALKGVYLLSSDIESDKATLVKRLKQYDPTLFTQFAVMAYPKRDRSTACVLYMQDLVKEK